MANSKSKSKLNSIKGPEGGVGVCYALSDPHFIDIGWTVLPKLKVVRRMNIYRTRPAKPELDWFEHNKSKQLITYDTGEKLAEFDENGRGRWYYRNGRLALDYYDAEEKNTQQRIVIYSTGEPDERGRGQPYTILATFDYLGNGIVFDHTGKIRLKYNQTEGVLLDRNVGPVSHWKWHTLNDPPVIQQIMKNTSASHKDHNIFKLGSDQVIEREDDEEISAIEVDKILEENNKKQNQPYKPFQIRIKTLKINENFSLKIVDQVTVYLIYRDGNTHLKLNIGMKLDPKEIIGTENEEIGEVTSNLEMFPAQTNSIAELQKTVSNAQRVEQLRSGHENRLRYPQTSKLTVPGIKTPTPPLLSKNGVNNYFNYSRKPTNSNVYYNTQL